MECGVDSFSLEVVRQLEFRQHGPSRIHEGPVLPLRNTILLRGVRGEIFMLDPLITQELIKGIVLELGSIVTYS